MLVQDMGPIGLLQEVTPKNLRLKMNHPCRVTTGTTHMNQHAVSQYNSLPRNGNRLNRNHLEICLSSSQKIRNSVTWVLAALTVCFTYPAGKVSTTSLSSKAQALLQAWPSVRPGNYPVHSSFRQSTFSVARSPCSFCLCV